MKINPGLIEDLIFNRLRKNLRFTQDSPVYPDVWLEFYRNAKSLATTRVDLILSPHRKASSAELFSALAGKLIHPEAGEAGFEAELASSSESIAVKLTFSELVNIVLPLTNWWQNYLWKGGKETSDFLWLEELVGAIHVASEEDLVDAVPVDDLMLASLREVFRKHYSLPQPGIPAEPPVLWCVSRNRKASFTIAKSVPCTKADAGRKLFGVDGTGIAWAVLDTGIDARHPLFRKTDQKTRALFDKAFGPKTDKFSNQTRVVETYDFTRFRKMLTQIHNLLIMPATVPKAIVPTSSDKNDESLDKTKILANVNAILQNLKGGRLFDWTLVAPLLKVPHNADEYVAPVHPHGSHVAGIIGAGPETQNSNEPMVGMCPAIDLYDIRVLDSEGSGDEFNILAAIQFVRWLNNKKEGPVIHGVNLSLSIPHEVSSYACGQTPVCEACDRLVGDGTIVVTAAGNNGQAMFQSKNGMLSEGFRTVNITDPGNADLVITVGSTHRNRPHSYGVSYFSSKGPTGDGRIKPDLVAPGEKIVSAGILDGEECMDGTSMAAPHVSGAAALLIARHRELIGRPRRVKEILCNTATDLGREKYFQGCGMVDVLRAIQSV